MSGPHVEDPRLPRRSLRRVKTYAVAEQVGPAEWSVDVREDTRGKIRTLAGYYVNRVTDPAPVPTAALSEVLGGGGWRVVSEWQPTADRQVTAEVEPLP